MKMIADPPIWILDDNSGKIWCFSMPEPNSDGKVTFQIPTKKCHYEFEFSSFFFGVLLSQKHGNATESCHLQMLNLSKSDALKTPNLGLCWVSALAPLRAAPKWSGSAVFVALPTSENAGPRLTQRQEWKHMGLSENRVYSQWNSHLIGIMISKTIGFRCTLFSDTPTWLKILKVWCNLIALLEHLHFFGEKPWGKNTVPSWAQNFIAENVAPRIGVSVTWLDARSTQ